MMLPPVGHEFKFQGDIFTIGYTSDKIVRFTSVAGGREQNLPLESFLKMMASEDFQHISDDFTNPYSRYDKEHIERRNELFSLIKFVEKRTDWPRSQKEIAPLLEEYGKRFKTKVISPSNFAKKYKAYVESGCNINALIPRHCDKGRKQRFFTYEQEEIATEVLRKHYFMETGKALTEVHKNLRIDLMETQGFQDNPTAYPRMSYSTLRRRTLDYDIAYRLKSKYGKRSAQKALRAPGNKLETGFPLEFVEADGYVVDCHVVDKETGALLGRPNLTLFIDRATRSVLSYTMSLKGFSIETLLPAFRAALRQDNGLPGGRISNIIVDNGKDYDSHSFRNAVMSVGADLKPCRIKDPNSKPFVESFFKTQNLRCFHTLNGTTFSNPEHRGDYESEDKACYTLEELDELFKMAVGEYHTTIHSQLEKAPILAWQDWLNEKDGFIQEVPLEEINQLINRVKKYSIKNGEIRIKGLSYKSHDLSAIASEMESLGRRPRATVFIDDYDLGHVYVENSLDPKQPLIKAYSREPERANGLTMNELDAHNDEISAQRKVQAERLAEMSVDEMSSKNQKRRNKIKDNALLREQRHIEHSKKQKQAQITQEKLSQPASPALPTSLQSINDEPFGEMGMENFDD